MKKAALLAMLWTGTAHADLIAGLVTVNGRDYICGKDYAAGGVKCTQTTGCGDFNDPECVDQWEARVSVAFADELAWQKYVCLDEREAVRRDRQDGHARTEYDNCLRGGYALGMQRMKEAAVKEAEERRARAEARAVAEREQAATLYAEQQAKPKAKRKARRK